MLVEVDIVRHLAQANRRYRPFSIHLRSPGDNGTLTLIVCRCCHGHCLAFDDCVGGGEGFGVVHQCRDDVLAKAGILYQSQDEFVQIVLGVDPLLYLCQHVLAVARGTVPVFSRYTG